MAKNKAVPFQENSTECLPGSADYRDAVHDIIDEAQWVGRGIPHLPEKVIVHDDSPYFDPSVKHIYKRD